MGQPGPQPIKLEEGEGAGSRMASAEKNRWWRKRCGAGQPMGMGSREHPASEPCWGLSVCVGGLGQGADSHHGFACPSLVWFVVLSTNTSSRVQKTCTAFKKKSKKTHQFTKYKLI